MSWRDHAACLDADPDWFFPEVGYGRGQDAIKARLICADCPVIDECLAWALAERPSVGIFGGTSPLERDRIRRERGLARKKRLKPCGTEAAYIRHWKANETPCEACREAHRVNQRKHREKVA